MMEISRTTLGIAVGLAGTLFLGYCVYFDQQRRKDPLFKKKLRERKAQQKISYSKSRATRLGKNLDCTEEHINDTAFKQYCVPVRSKVAIGPEVFGGSVGNALRYFSYCRCRQYKKYPSNGSPSGREKAQNSTTKSRNLGGPLPDMSDHEAMQRFFLQQIQLGEELLAAGDLEAGVEHLGQAVTVCGQTQQLLSVLQQTMPAPIFHLLLKKLPEVSERLRASMRASGGNTLQEEDVE